MRAKHFGAAVAAGCVGAWLAAGSAFAQESVPATPTAVSTPAPSTQAGQFKRGDKVIVENGTVVRAKPKTSAEMVERVDDASPFEVSYVGKWWAQVRRGPTIGYVPLVKMRRAGMATAGGAAPAGLTGGAFAPGDIVRVKDYGTPLRKTPDAKADTIVSLAAKDPLQVVESDPQWVKVSSVAGTGYVPSMSLVRVDDGAFAQVILDKKMAVGTSLSGPPIRVVVYDLTSADMAREQTDLISSSLLGEIRKLNRVSAMGMSEVKALLSLEEQKQMLGCESDEGCLVEIAGALGSDFLVLGSIGKVGESNVLGLRRVNMHNAQTTHSINRRMTGGGGEEYLEALGPGVAELFPEYELRPGRTRGVAPEVVQRWNPPPLKPWVFWSVTGASLGAFAVAGWFTWQQSSAKGEYNDLLDEGQSVQIRAVEVRDAEDRYNRNKRYALYSIIGGGVLAAGAGVTFLFTDWQGGVAVTPTVTPGGGGLSLAAGY